MDTNEHCRSHNRPKALSPFTWVSVSGKISCGKNCFLSGIARITSPFPCHNLGNLYNSLAVQDSSIGDLVTERIVRGKKNKGRKRRGERASPPPNAVDQIVHINQFELRSSSSPWHNTLLYFLLQWGALTEVWGLHTGGKENRKRRRSWHDSRSKKKSSH